MKQTIFIVCMLALVAVSLQSQSRIAGSFPGHARQAVTLSVYEGFQVKQVAETTADSVGNFTITSPAGYRGVVFLQANKAAGIEVLVMQTNDFSLKGTALSDLEHLTCTGNEATATLYAYYRQQVACEKALAGWRYLSKAYADDTFLKKYKKTAQLTKEIAQLEKERSAFIGTLPATGFLRWYLPLISFVRDIPVALQRNYEQIPRLKEQFMQIDFADDRLYRSGLQKALTENYFYLLENSGKSLDSVYVAMNRSTDYMLSTLQTKRPAWLQETSLFLFNMFEKRSLFTAAEHVSQVMLTQNSCVLDGKVSNRFEGYRTMKRGNNAPDIDFTQAVAVQKEKHDETLPEYLKGYASLSAIPAKYKLVVFGFADCPECEVQVPQLKQMYASLQQHGVEVVYVSLDTEKDKFVSVAADKPWVSYFDYAGWDSTPVVAYHVFASPTMFLLGEKQEILYKVLNPQHLDAILNILK